MSGDNILIRSGAGFSLGFISGILYGLKAPSPNQILIESMMSEFLRMIDSLPIEAKIAGLLVLAFVLIQLAWNVSEIAEILAGGVVCYALGFIAALFIISNIQILVLIAVLVLLFAGFMGWTKK